MNGKQQPTLTIITVVKNDRDGLKETINSIKRQKVSGVELVIVDGLSSDGTAKIAETLKDSDDTLISERDNGIYDAMNKGLSVASGMWCQFLNAGDVFYEDETLQKVFPFLESEGYDFVAGGSLDVDQGRVVAEKYPRNLWWRCYGMIAHHQAMFFRLDIIKSNKLEHDKSLRIAADYKFFMEYLYFAKGYRRIDRPLIVFEAGGLSQSNYKKGRIEQKIVRRQHYNLLVSFLVTTLQAVSMLIRRSSSKVYSLIRRLG